MTWQPLVVREGWTKVEAPYEGVPSHLKRPLLDWVEATLFPTTSDGLEAETICQIVVI